MEQGKVKIRGGDKTREEKEQNIRQGRGKERIKERNGVKAERT